MEFWWQQFEYLLRIVIAAICGGLIGFERKNRLKAAGIRTHLLVALAASLMMVISKYGFDDIVFSDNIKLDPSRIASGIVTGISFLGAGLIFVRKQEISGITTAAGIWATVGVGMAIGSGMYFIGITSCLLIIVSQIILHKDIKILKEPIHEQITLELDFLSEALETLKDYLEKNNVEILQFEEKIKDKIIYIKITAKFPTSYNHMDVISFFQSIPYIKSFKI